VLDTLRTLGARLFASATNGRLDADFERELDAHLDLLTDENIARGMTRDEARQAALRRVGNRGSLRGRHRDVRGFPGLEALRQDTAFAVRLLIKNAGFSAAAIITIALGIGVNAMGFSIMHAAFLRPMPFEDGKALHMVAWAASSTRRVRASVSEFDVWRDRARSFTGLAGFETVSMSLSDDLAAPEQIDGAWVTANAFDLLKQPPLIGRGFSAADGEKGAEAVVLIGARVWRNRYASAPAVLGRAVRLNGQPATIVGVMPEGMHFPLTADIWAPRPRNEESEQRSARALSVFGRLAHDTDPAAAQTELDGLARQHLPPDADAMKGLTGIRVESFNDFFVGGRARPLFLVVMGAVCFVLLIACVNVANLLLSRAVGRGREMAVRVSMGATRVRLIAQLLIESALLSVIGGAFGLWLARFGLAYFDAALENTGRPYFLTFSIDPFVIGYVVALSLLTTILFGLAPALHISKANANEVLKEGGRGAVGSRRTRWMTGTLVVVELALTVVLLVGAAHMARSFFNVYSIDIGVPTDGLMSMRIELPAFRYSTPDARLQFFTRVETQLASSPGFEAVAVSTGVPPFDGGERLVEVEGQVNQTADRFVSTVTISQSFFATLNGPIASGRAFQRIDALPERHNVIVNQRFAEVVLAAENPIGRRIRLKDRNREPGPWQTVVGISSTIRHGSFQDFEPNAVVYSLLDREPPRAAAVIVRSHLPPSAVMKTVRATVQSVDPDQPVRPGQTIEEAIAEASWPLRVFGALFAVFGVIALALSAVGLYGVMATAVSEQTSEIGVRMALGATWGSIASHVLGRGLKHLAVGLSLGIAGAIALSLVLQNILVRVNAGDPVTFAVIALLLTVVAALACLIPARRAARVDPVTALRAE
jgi:putative ABC transport system permease protein